MAARKYSRIQEKGQVTLPADFRRKMGLEKGDLVTFEEMDGGLLITPREVLSTRALNEIGAALREQGLCLEDLIESGNEDRIYNAHEIYDQNAANERD